MAQELRKLAPKLNLVSPLICPVTILVIIQIDLTKLPKGSMGLRNGSMRPIAAATKYSSIVYTLFYPLYQFDSDLDGTH